MMSALQTAYIVYRSAESAKKILYRLEGKANINGEPIKIDFYQVNLEKPRASALDASLLQDWICNKCEYKNYAKRVKCHKCENMKNSNCRAVYNTPVFPKKQTTTAHMMSRTYTETRINRNACEAIMVKSDALKMVSSEAVRRDDNKR